LQIDGEIGGRLTRFIRPPQQRSMLSAETLAHSINGYNLIVGHAAGLSGSTLEKLRGNSEAALNLQ